MIEYMFLCVKGGCMRHWTCQSRSTAARLRNGRKAASLGFGCCGEYDEGAVRHSELQPREPQEQHMVRLPRDDRVQGGHSGVRVHGVRRRALRAEVLVICDLSSGEYVVRRGGGYLHHDTRGSWYRSRRGLRPSPNQCAAEVGARWCSVRLVRRMQ